MLRFADSAFRHEYTEEDYYEVLESSPLKTKSRRGLRDVYEIYGRNFVGDYLHIALRKVGGETVVFHMRRMDGRERRYDGKRR